jgi:hypothetical protein
MHMVQCVAERFEKAEHREFAQWLLAQAALKPVNEVATCAPPRANAVTVRRGGSPASRKQARAASAYQRKTPSQ